MLEYKVENQSGSSGTLTPDEITQQLASSGEVVKGISPDGQKITLTNSQGADFQVKTSDLLQELGWKVNGIEPTDVIEDFVKPELRVAVANLGSDDQTKKLYLQEKLKDMGLNDANIVGQGTDFYVWHPESNKYFALTNKRGMDMSDIASGLSQAPGFIGGAQAGAAGALGGFGIGSIPLAMGGAAAGQLAGDIISRGALAWYDPTFRKIASEHLGEQASDLAGNALISGGTAGLFKAVPMAVGAMRGTGSQAPGLLKGVLNNGPVSSVVRGLGAGTEEAAGLAATIAKPFQQKGLAQGLATTQGPLAPVQQAGLLFKAPGSMSQWLAEKYGQFGGKAGKEFVQGLPKDEAGELLLGELGEKAGQELGKHIPGFDSAMGEAMGRKTGDFFQRGMKYGQKLEDFSEGATGLAAKGIYGLGRAAQTFGAAANRTARAAAPLENRLYAKYGAEELGLDRTFDDYLRRRKTPINSQLANQYE